MLQNRRRFLQCGWSQPIVIIHPAQIAAPRCGDRGLQSNRMALVFSQKNPHSWVLIGKGLGYFHRSISGAVYPDQQFKVGIGLGQNTGDRGGQKTFAVIGRNDNGNLRVHGASVGRKGGSIFLWAFSGIPPTVHWSESERLMRGRLIWKTVVFPDFTLTGKNSGLF